MVVARRPTDAALKVNSSTRMRLRLSRWARPMAYDETIRLPGGRAPEHTTSML